MSDKNEFRYKIKKFLYKNSSSFQWIIILIILFIIFLLNLVFTSERDSIISFLNKYSLLIAPFLLVIVTCFYTIYNKKMLWHKVLQDLHKDYRSFEMSNALNVIWDFYRDCDLKGKDVAEEYETRYLVEKERNMSVEKTLHHNRRIVIHFYNHLATINRYNIVKKRLIFDWWFPSDFKMFDLFLFKVMRKTTEMLDSTPEEVEYVIKQFKKLKEDCDFYYDIKDD
jgi:hypothetical protein